MIGLAPTGRNYYLPATVCLLVISYVGISFYFLSEYFITDLNVYLGLLLAPFILKIEKGTYSKRYLLPALLLLLLAFIIPIKTIFFLTLLAAILLLLESTVGKTGYYFLFLLLLLSPVFKYFSNVIGFPVRLWLSEVAGKIIQLAGNDVEVSGNLIVVNGLDFSVDPACAGIKMMATSFIVALFILGYNHKKRKNEFSLLFVTVVLAGTFVLNVFANLVRIIILVLFDIGPESILHDAIGIACLGLYVLFPLIKTVNHFSGKGISGLIKQQNLPAIPLKNVLLNLALVVIMVPAGIKIKNAVARNSAVEVACSIPDFKKEVLKSGVIKFTTKTVLVYVKPVTFYSSEHNPLICWTGSGYEFKHVNKELHGNVKIYTGILEKNNESIYTAWWFDDGIIKTTNHLEWRWQALTGKRDFSLVNISAVSPIELQSGISRLINQNIFN